jgi:hypothetical protein
MRRGSHFNGTTHRKNSATPAVVVVARPAVRAVVVEARPPPIVEARLAVVPAVVSAPEVAAVVISVAVAVEVVMALTVIPVRAPPRVIEIARAPVVFRQRRWLSVRGGRNSQAGQPQACSHRDSGCC